MSITSRRGGRSLQRLAFLKYYNVQNFVLPPYEKTGSHTDNSEFGILFNISVIHTASCVQETDHTSNFVGNILTQ